MSIGPGGTIDCEWPRWSAAGMANILDQTPEGDFAGARENPRLYRNRVGHYSDVVVTRDVIRLYQAGLGRYAPTREPSPALESTAPTDAFAAPLPAAALTDLRTRSFAERMRTLLPGLAGVVPDGLTSRQLRTTHRELLRRSSRKTWTAAPRIAPR